MAVTKYMDKGTGVIVGGDLEAMLRRHLSVVERESVRILEEAAEDVKTKAQAEWYSRVNRETGKGGDIAVITVIDAGKNEVRVSVGSTDTEMVNGKPRVVFIHAPRATSLIKKQVSAEVYWATPEKLRANFKALPADKKNGRPGDPPGSGPYIWVQNPKAGDGKFLLQELIKKPARAKIKRISAEMRRTVAAKIKGG